MLGSLERRLELLEQRHGGIEEYIVLVGEEVELFDAAYVAGDDDAALAVLARANPYALLEDLRDYSLRAASVSIDDTRIRIE
jgi:hypothetical protein